jgi:protein associated with RNAse G/E
LGINIIDVDIDEFIEEINKHTYPGDMSDFLNSGINKPTMEMALYIYGALSRLITKYNFSAITVRCFDLLSLKHNTGCLALALLN